MPGLIEGHSHLLLHPYNETAWNDQVLREPLALRVARAVNHARATLMAGSRRSAISEPRVPPTPTSASVARSKKGSSRAAHVVAGPAMVVTGSYGPKGSPGSHRAPGRGRSRGLDGVVRVARNQIAHGVDFIEIYADYRWGPNGETRPSFTQDETAESWRPPTAVAVRWLPTRRLRKACGARSSAGSRPSRR